MECALFALSYHTGHDRDERSGRKTEPEEESAVVVVVVGAPFFRFHRASEYNGEALEEGHKEKFEGESVVGIAMAAGGRREEEAAAPSAAPPFEAIPNDEETSNEPVGRSG